MQLDCQQYGGAGDAKQHRAMRPAVLSTARKKGTHWARAIVALSAIGSPAYVARVGGVKTLILVGNGQDDGGGDHAKVVKAEYKVPSGLRYAG